MERACACVDVVVVGGGVSGIYTAHQLRKQSKSDISVCVVEAGDRVGGRTWTLPPPYPPLDVGGMWIGYEHKRLQKLAAELKLKTYKQHIVGKKVLYGTDGPKRYSGTIPPVSPVLLVKLQAMLWRLDAMAKELDPEKPYLCPKAYNWDTQSAFSFAKQYFSSAEGLALFRCVVCMLLGVEMQDVSLLFLLYYVRTNAYVDQLLETVGAAQESRVVGGMQRVCEELVAAMKPCEGSADFRRAGVLKGVGEGVTVVTRATCWRISQTTQERTNTQEFPSHTDSEAKIYPVAVHIRSTDAGLITSLPRDSTKSNLSTKITTGVIRARYVCVAVPPSVSHRIEMLPAPSYSRELLFKKAVMGCYTKAIFVYSRAFWRDAGLSGEVVNPYTTVHNPIMNLYDYSSHGYAGGKVENDGKSRNMTSFPSVKQHLGWVEARFDEHTGDESQEEYAACIGFITGITAQQLARLPARYQVACVVNSVRQFFGADHTPHPNSVFPGFGKSVGHGQDCQDAQSTTTSSATTECKSSGGSRSHMLRAVYIHAWSSHPLARGCPATSYNVGSFVRSHPELTHPHGRVHFASTETATEFTGYIEGALQAGDRASQEIISRLKGNEEHHTDGERKDGAQATGGFVEKHGWVGPAVVPWFPARCAAHGSHSAKAVKRRASGGDSDSDSSQFTGRRMLSLYEVWDARVGGGERAITSDKQEIRSRQQVAQDSVLGDAEGWLSSIGVKLGVALVAAVGFGWWLARKSRQ